MSWTGTAVSGGDSDTGFLPSGGDPGDVLAVDGNGQLVWVPPSPANVKAFGAKGDGAANDTAAIQAAVDAVEAAGGGVVFIPCGTYRTTGTITIGGFGVVLQGESGGAGAFGSKGSVVSYEGTEDAIVLGDRINEMQYGLGVRDLSIKGTAAGRCGIRMGSVLEDANSSIYNVDISNVFVSGFTSTTAVHPMATHNSGAVPETFVPEYSVPIVGGCGMLIHRGVNCRIELCDFRGNWIGCLEASHHMATTYTFSKCYFHENNSVGLRLSDSVCMSFRDCIFEANKHQGVVIQPFPTANIESCYSIVFTGCYFEYNCEDSGTPSTYNFEAFGLGSGLVFNLTMRDCLINPNNGKNGIKLVNVKAFHLDNVRVQNSTSVAFNTDTTSTGMVIGPSSSASGYIQGLHVLGASTVFLESYAGNLKVAKLYLENPDTNQLTVINSPGNHFTLEVNPTGLVLYRAFGAGASHYFVQSLLCNGDLESTLATKGLVLKAPGGNRWRFTVTDAGVLSAANLGA